MNIICLYIIYFSHA